MGEIADMVLDGTMCQGCGEFIYDGADGPGYPGYCCTACEQRDRPEPARRTKPRNKRKLPK